MNRMLAELMAKTDPKLYRSILLMRKERKNYIYLSKKMLYGMMKSALLFYCKLVS
jgi:hypothetical protein